MEPTILVIGAVVAVTAVVVAFLVDRDAASRRRAILSTPPTSPVVPDDLRPTYLTPEEIRAQGRAVEADPVAEAARRADVTARLTGVEPLPVGWPSPDFVTDAETDRAVLEAPLVVVADDVRHLADVRPLLERAREAGTGLVLVAQHLAPEVLATLSLNAAAGRLAALAVVTDDPGAIAERVGTTMVSGDDLTAGYVPDDAVGRCDLWVSDATRSWIVLAESPASAPAEVV